MAVERKRKNEYGVIPKEIMDEKLLVEAAKSGNFREVEELLNAGVSPDTPEYNRQLFYQSENYMTPLHYATANGFAELVKLFLLRGGIQSHMDIIVRLSFCPHIKMSNRHATILNLFLRNLIRGSI